MKFWLVLILILVLILSVATSASAASPDGTRIPPATEIIDSGGNRWVVGQGKAGDPLGLINVNLMVYCGGVVYARTPVIKDGVVGAPEGPWYTGKVGATWTQVSSPPPCL